MAVQISGNDITVPRDTTVTRNLTVGGVLTYEDVTNVDSVGLITARSGIEIGASPGVAASISVDGNAIFSGITTVGGNADIEGALVVGNGVAAPLSGFSAHFHADATSNKIQITTSNTGVTNADGAIIMVDSGSNMEILNRENSNIEFFTNNSQHMTLDSSGRLLLGTTTEGHSNGDDLTIATSGSTGITLRSGTSASGSIFFSDGTSGDAEYAGLVQYDHASNFMRFYANSSERARIDSSGRLLLGTTTLGESSADNLTVADSGHCGITIRSGTSNEGNLFFTDATSDQFQGYVKYNHSDNDLAFGTNKIERMSLTSDGFLTHQDGKKCAFNVKGGNMSRTDAGGYICQFSNKTGTGCFDSGSNFDTSTYKFTAPVSGYYFFFTNIRLDNYSEGYIRTAFLSTDQGTSSYWTNPSTGHVISYPTTSNNIMQVSTSTIMNLDKDDEVYVYQDPSSDSSFTVYLGESSFGGYFIG